MEESMKKTVMIVVIVACLVSAALITFLARKSRSATGLSEFAGKMQLVKCANKNCVAVYEIDKEKYYELVEEELRKHVDDMGPLAITCEKCGENSIFRAVKCEKCGEVFFSSEVGANDFPDRCPKCGHSAMEEQKKKGRKGG
jgi:predicted Zn-ribbon and HTH transcriptional regulator